MAARTKRVALLGECMVELRGDAFGTMRQGYGGDTLNTAIYLARCGAANGIVPFYATGLGEDGLSSGMLVRWAAEGIDNSLVLRIPDRLPGLYMIEVDEQGERRFSYWRDNSAAKAYFDNGTTPLELGLSSWDALYLSGISLAILSPSARERVFRLMQSLRERGSEVVFDNNYRPRLWARNSEAREAFNRAYEISSIALVTADDHQALFMLPSLEAAVASAKDLPCPEVVIKRGAAATLVHCSGKGERHRSVWQEVPTEPVPQVVDTTAAGDAFAGGYLSRRLSGASAEAAALFGNRLASRVIQHHGALIAPALMADLATGLV